MDFKEANKVVHKVEDDWHYPIMIKYGFKPTENTKAGFVRRYSYKNDNGYEIHASVGASADHWSDITGSGFGFWSGLEPHLKKLKTDKII